MREKLALLKIKTIGTKPIQREIKQQFIAEASEKRLTTTQTQLAMLSKIMREYVGTITAFMGQNIPPGWLLCDGSKVAKDKYFDLFSVLGVEEDEEGNFILPDLRGKVLIGQHPDDSAFDSLWKTGGAKTHTLTVDQLPSHNHEITDNGHIHTGTTSFSGNHNHTVNDAYFAEHQPDVAQQNVTGTAETIDNDNELYTRNIVTGDSGNHNHTFITDNSKTNITINNTGNNQAFNILQPYVVVNYIIRY